jgi:DNA polymerase I
MAEPPSRDAPRLFLIDAYSLIYRSFFAFIHRPLISSRGENTSAPWGFVNFLLRIREEYQPDYLAVVFDSGLSHREKLYPEYKATREKMPDELRASLPRIREIVAAFHDEVVELDGYEADDVIGTLARKADEAGIESVVVSGDKDFYQLVGPRVHLLNPGRGGPTGVAAEWVDESNASERLGVSPNQVVDFLALVGDASDNVPGAPGIGAGWALRLLTEIGPLEALLDNPEAVPWDSKRRSLAENAEQIRLSKRLVTIETDLDVPLDLEKLAVRQPDGARLTEILAELEFHSLIPKIASDVATAGSTAGSDADFSVVESVQALRRPIEAIRTRGRTGMWLLATEADAVRAEVVGIALSWDEGEGVYVPLRHDGEARTLLDQDVGDPVSLPPITDESMADLKALLEDPGVSKVGHDVKRDLLLLENAGVELKGGDGDTMIAAYVLDPGRRQNTLAVLAAEVLGVVPAPEADLVGKGQKKRGFQELPPDRIAPFACERADLVRRLWTRFQSDLDRQQATDLYEKLELPLVPVLAEMERVGIRIDAAFFAEMSRTLDRDLRLIREEIHKEAGTEFNVNSNPQLREILFEKLGLPVIRKTKTGPSTDASVLEELAALGHALPRHLLEYRQLEKLRSTYVDALPRLVNPRTGRIHTSFNQTVAATGRLSSSDPNLQNIPIRSDIGRKIRKGFVADVGKHFLAADYSQIELRVLAHFSGDAAFVTAFTEGIDVHRQTASVIFDLPIADVTDDQRAQAKTINFATLYGQGEFSLARQLGISREEAGAFIASYFERFAGVRAFLDEQVALAKERGYVETLSGRRRYIPELRDKNWNVRQFGERVAQNTPIQGTAADLIKLAMIRIHDDLGERALDAKLLLQVHDELVLEVPDEEGDEVREIVTAGMEGAMELAVPLEVEVGTGRTWYDCKV